jgi:ethanolamine utilization protein EutA
MTSEVKLVGLDFGSTTSSAVIASAQLTRNAVTHRSELTGIHEIFRSRMVFTPFNDDRLDEIVLTRYLDDWLASGRVDPEQVFGGGALLTGLAAQQANAPAVVRTIRNRLRNALIATADDPSLESWLAFMGSCAGLSRMHPEVPIVNLDIGGGTTNLALGRAGNVLRTGCLYVGARHIQVTPGSYRISRLSRYARELLAELRIAKGVGDCLSKSEVEAVLTFYMTLLTAAIDGNTDLAENRVARLHEVSPLSIPPDIRNVVVTVSGGVGSLIYSRLSGEPWPSTTCFGDLGIDLARMLLSSKWAECFHNFVPQSTGRATVYGLLRHNTEVSGNTLFLPNPECLPLTDVPIFGVIASHSTDAEIENLTALVQKSPRGACLRIDLSDDDGASVRSLAQRFSRILKAQRFPAEQPLVLLVEQNVGKVLGHYVTEWGALPLNLVVIDEIAERYAQYVRIGRVHEQVVPVSFYGLHDHGDTDEDANASR